MLEHTLRFILASPLTLGFPSGFCTPGIIVSLYTLLSNSNSVKTVEEHLDGNLCRCTGYRPIWDAARALCSDAEELVRGPCGTPCRECPERDVCQQDCNVADKETAESSSSISWRPIVRTTRSRTRRLRLAVSWWQTGASALSSSNAQCRRSSSW